VQLFVTLPKGFVPQGLLRITITDPQGRLVHAEQLASMEAPFLLRSPSTAGIYHVHLSDATRWISGAKLVVE